MSTSAEDMFAEAEVLMASRRLQSSHSLHKQPRS